MWSFSESCCTVCRSCSSSTPAAGKDGSSPASSGGGGDASPFPPAAAAAVSPKAAAAAAFAPASTATGNRESLVPAGQTAVVSNPESAPATAGAKVGPSPLPLPSKAQMDTETASVASTTKNSTRSAYSGASSIGSDLISDHIPAHQREVIRIQSQMKHFVKGMVRGREMNVLSVDGQIRACSCSFDRKLRNYIIVINKETRTIPLSKLKEVFQGTEPDDIATPLDELCSTVVLDNGECLTFRFKDVAERENFAMCLQIIVDGHRQ
eukprot:TRINITY_DN17723_c0_g1_i1.p1 TRINITY_DN17723_c0_g1~~TRINITY_DN17723_c0_g1_i1.p1  ORF type:complete len:266 (+),score=43.46 TRINITY_DN17723_c0_g1_i1:172-969(+)